MKHFAHILTYVYVCNEYIYVPNLDSFISPRIAHEGKNSLSDRIRSFPLSNSSSQTTNYWSVAILSSTQVCKAREWRTLGRRESEEVREREKGRKVGH